MLKIPLTSHGDVTPNLSVAANTASPEVYISQAARQMINPTA